MWIKKNIGLSFFQENNDAQKDPPEGTLLQLDYLSTIT